MCLRQNGKVVREEKIWILLRVAMGKECIRDAAFQGHPLASVARQVLSEGSQLHWRCPYCCCTDLFLDPVTEQVSRSWKRFPRSPPSAALHSPAPVSIVSAAARTQDAPQLWPDAPGSPCWWDSQRVCGISQDGRTTSYSVEENLQLS